MSLDQATSWRSVALYAMALTVLLLAVASPATAQDDFTYNPPGVLVAGSGEGRVDERVYAPGMRFPIEVAPAYANSQVWGNGGMNGPGGWECDDVNYSYPWWDNYCETRARTMPLCPAGQGHQGQDIRPATCDDVTYWAVAAEAGEITSIGSYSVWLTTADGTLHRYLHMDPASVTVNVGDSVSRGERLGLVSNAFGGESTTVHLHYDIGMNVAEHGFVYVPPYLSLVESYEVLLGEEGRPCHLLPDDGDVIDNDSLCFILHGPQATWRFVDGEGYGGDLYWTYAWEGDQSNWAEWLLSFSIAGEYRVEVYVTPAYAQSQLARYTVRHDGGEDELSVDLSAADGWLEIGTFEFAEGGGQNVAVYDNTGENRDLERRIPADAVRLTLLNPPVEPEPDVGPADTGPADTGVPDTGVPDTGVVDSGPPDTGMDTSGEEPRPDTGVVDTAGQGEAGGEPGQQDISVTTNSGCGCAVKPSMTGTQVAFGLALLGLIGLVGCVRRRRRRACGWEPGTAPAPLRGSGLSRRVKPGLSSELDAPAYVPRPLRGRSDSGPHESR